MSTAGPGPADHLLNALLEVLAERVADKIAARMGASAPRYATARDNPIGSARAFLDAARRGDFPTFRRGRCVAALWSEVERHVESRKVKRDRQARSDDDDERTVLLRKGLVLRQGRRI